MRSKKTVSLLILLLLVTANIILIPQTVVSDEPEPIPEPYLYEEFIAPPSSFGIGNTTFKTVNWTYFKQLFNSHCDWMLEYKRYDYSAWTDGSSYMTIEKTWNESLGGWKFNLILDVPVDVYSARFTFGCSLPVLDYVERDGWQVNLNYTVPGTNETYNCYFNWSDMASIPNIIFNKGRTDDMFWFRFRRDNIPSGHYEFDPTFGGTGTGSESDAYQDYIMGTEFTCPSNGTADSISVYTKTETSDGTSENIKCAIYNTSDSALIGCTEEKNYIGTTTPFWLTLNITSGGTLVTGTGYYLVWWQSNTGNKYCYFFYFGNNGGVYDSEIYNGFPSTASFTTWSNHNFSIYCSYTEPIENNNPTSSGESPTNSTTIASTAPSCQDLYAIVTDNDGDTMNATWHSNSSGSWVQFASNSSIANNTNITQCNSNFTTCETTYYWSINISDGEGGYTNDTFHFTTPTCINNIPTQSGESPTNTSTGISVTPNLYVVCTDSDSDTMNATWRSNSSGSWVTFATNSSISTGTNITQPNSNFSAYSTKYWWSVSLEDGMGDWDNETYHFTTEASATITVDVSPDTWLSGNIGVGIDIQENFTFYQNGTATIDITIGINSTNFTFVNYTSWLSLGHNRYCANFSNDSWASENMIEPGYPPTSVLNASFAPGSFPFGIRIWMPRTVSYSSKQEDFEITLVVSESS